MAHEELKKIYEADALWHPRPWEMWEYRVKCLTDADPWDTLDREPDWYPSQDYRRKPDAPQKNCAMCKLRTNHHPNDCPLDQNYRHIKFYVVDNGRGCPDWCPLDQPKEEPLPQCDKCGSSYLWPLKDGEPAVCCNVKCGNKYQPKTELGKQLQAIREKAIENGMPLLGESALLEGDSLHQCDKALAAFNNLHMAAKDLLIWLESFDITKGSDNIKALREALDELEEK